MLNIFIAVGYGQVKGSIIYKRETVLTTDKVTKPTEANLGDDQ